MNITKNNPKIKAPTFEEVLKSYNDLRLFGKIMAMLYLPIINLDSKCLDESTNGSNGFKEFILGDKKKQVVLNYLDDNEIYRNIVKETLMDFLN